MANVRLRFWSSIGKKLLTGVTGVGLVGFIIAHVAGNLTLFVGADAFNAYAHALHSYGKLVYVFEVGLLVLFALHAASALSVWVDNRRARTVRNTSVESKGAPSRQSLASRSMIITGGVLLAFTVLHVLQFRFGPGETAGYVTTVHGEPARDLYRLVVETFASWPWVVVYMAVMVLLGFHLRHGVWSAFQSLGLLTPRLRALLFPAGLLVGILVAAAFFAMPIYLHLFGVSVPADSVSMGMRP
jgi:succinate dehydrogenase / fumarate reductase cytochrome b subunit